MTQNFVTGAGHFGDDLRWRNWDTASATASHRSSASTFTEFGLQGYFQPEQRTVTSISGSDAMRLVATDLLLYGRQIGWKCVKSSEGKTAASY
jgi:hypothetical protein